jgi:hypothetical protein
MAMDMTRFQQLSPSEKIARKIQGFYAIEALYLFLHGHNDAIVWRNPNYLVSCPASNLQNTLLF